MTEVGGSDSKDERLGNNENLMSLIRNNAPLADIKKAFLEEAVSPVYQNGEKDTPLHLAIRRANKEVVEFLLTKGADLNVPNNNSKTAINLIEEKLKICPDDLNLRSIKYLLCQYSPGTSKRSADDDGFPRATPRISKISKFKDTSIDSATAASPSTSRKRSLDLNVTHTKRLKEPDSYEASDLKHTLHDIIFQFKLLSLFTIRAIRENYDFLLATEMNTAEKFDDVVFRHEVNGERYYRFLQVNHKLETNNVITIADLMTFTDGDYSLQKYFLSFCKFKKNEMFKDGVLKDFIIYINVDKNVKFSEDKCSNFFLKDTRDILYLQNITVGKLQLNINQIDATSEGLIFRLFMKLVLLKTALELHFIKNNSNFNNVRIVLEEHIKMEKLLINLMLVTKKNLDRKILLDTAEEASGLLKLGQDHEVVQAANKIQNSEKSNQEDIKDVLNKLLRYLNVAVEDTEVLNQVVQNLQGLKTQTSKSTTHDEILNILNKLGLKEYEFKKNTVKILSLSNLNDAKKACIEIIDEELTKVESGFIILELSLSDSMFEKEFQDFAKKFAVIVNYVSEEELGEIIKEELGERFLLLNADAVSIYFQEKMLVWLKFYKNAGFLTPQMARNHLDSIKRQMNILLSAGLNEAYLKELRKYKINFKSTTGSFSSLKNCLEDFFIDQNKQILHIKSKCTLLSSIKLLGLLQSVASANCEKRDYFIFVKLKTLLFKGMQELVVHSFSTGESQNLLIIKCPRILQQNSKVEELFIRLSSVFWDDKKIVIVTHDEDLLCEKFRKVFWNVYESYTDKSTFSDLEDDSQKHLLTNTRVLLHSSTEQDTLHLEDFLDKDLAESIIDGDILSYLLENSVKETPIVLGNDEAFSSVGYNQDYYIKRKFHLQSISREILKNSDNSELLFISGATKDDLVELGAPENAICEAPNDQKNNKKIILSVSEKPDELFTDICTKYASENVHWLRFEYEYDEYSFEHYGVLFWTKTKGNMSTLFKYIDSGVSTMNRFLSEDFFIGNNNQKVVILANDSGMGKSTVITNIAREIKMKMKTVWVVRINLNDYANDKEPNCLSKIEDNWQKHESLDFLTKMATSGVSCDDVLVRFQHELFRRALDKKPKFQVVIFFDGFDEISPNYKDKTCLLLEALQSSSIAQICVTTRVHEKESLEKRLKTASHILSPFNYVDRETFLTKYLAWKLTFQEDTFSEKSEDDVSLERFRNALSSISDYLEKTSPEDMKNVFKEVAKNQYDDAQLYVIISRYVKTLLSNWDKTVNRYYRSETFTFTPLHLEMLADIVFENQFQLPTDLEILSSYEKFVQIKFDIYHREKTATTAGNVGAETKDYFFSEILRKVHQELAVILFFPEEYSKKSLPGLKNAFDDFIEIPRKNRAQELTRVGLVCLRNGGLNFVHRSFAEYFLSDYLFKNLQHVEVQKILIKKVLKDFDYFLVRQFFNDQLNQYYKYKFRELNLDKQLKEQRISQDSFEKKLSEIRFHEDLLNDGNGIESAVLTAFNENFCGIICFICEKCKGREEIMREMLIEGIKDLMNDKSTFFLHVASYEGKHECFEILWENLVEYPNFLKEIVVKKDSDGNTVLLSAAMGNNHEILKEILDTFTSDESIMKNFISPIEEQLKIAVDVATRNGYHESIKVILEALKNFPNLLQELVLNSQKRGKNCLQLAVSKNYFEATEIILGALNSDIKKRLMFSTDPLGKTALFLACESKNREITQVLVENVDDDETVEDLLIISAHAKSGELETNVATLFDGVVDVVGENSKICHYLLSMQDQIRAIVEKASALHAALKKKDFVKVENIYSTKDAFPKHLILARDNSGKNSLELAIEIDAVELVEYFLRNFCKYDNVFKTILSYTDETDKSLLHKIALSGKTDIAKAFLTHVNSDVLEEMILKFDEIDATPLHYAIINNHANIVKDLVDFVKTKNMEIYNKMLTTTFDGRTILHLIFAKGHRETLETLLQVVEFEIIKSMIFIVDKRGKSALFPVENFDKTEMLSLILNWFKDDIEITSPGSLKIFFETTTDKNENILHFAVKNASIETLDMLMKFIIDNTGDETLCTLMLQYDYCRRTPLIMAIEIRCYDEFNVIIDNISQPTRTESLQKLDHAGNTLLHFICGNCYFDNNIYKMKKHIFDWYKSNLNNERVKQAFLQTNREGQTALITSLHYTNLESLQLLFDVLKDDRQLLNKVLLKTDLEGYSALHWATISYEYIISYPPCKLTKQDIISRYENVFKTFLDLTEMYCSSSTFKELLFIVDNRGRSFLLIAALEGRLDIFNVIFRVLNDRYNDVIADLFNTVDNCKRTVLHWAYWKNHTGVVQFLMETTETFSDLHKNLSSIKHKLDETKEKKASLEEAILNNDAIEIDIILKNYDNKRELALALYTVPDSFFRYRTFEEVPSSLLVFAVKHAEVKSFEKLIQHIDDDILIDQILDSDEDGITAIGWAISRQEQPFIFKALLKKTKKDPMAFKKLFPSAKHRLLLEDIFKEKDVFKKTMNDLFPFSELNSYEFKIFKECYDEVVNSFDV